MGLGGTIAEAAASGWGVALAAVNALQTIILAWLAGEHVATRRHRRNGSATQDGSHGSARKSERSPD